MRSRICSSCGQARNRQQYSNNQWRRNPAVARCSFCVGDDLQLPRPDRQTVQFQQRVPPPETVQQPSQKSSIRIGFIPDGRSSKISAELVENGTVIRKIGVWALPPCLAVRSTRIKCLHVRKAGVSISNSHAMFAVALAGATKSESGVAVFKFDQKKYPRYLWFCHNAVRSQFYDNFIRVWDGSKKYNDYSLSDWRRLERFQRSSTHRNITSSANMIPDDAWILILRLLDINDLISLSRIPVFRKLVRARMSLGSDDVIYQTNVHEMSSSAVFSTCSKVYLSRDGYTISCFVSGTGREIASWTLPVIDRPDVRLEILEKGVALSPCMNYVAVVMEFWPGDQNDNGFPNQFDNTGNLVVPEPFGVSIFSISQSGSSPLRVHEGQYRAVCFDGSDLLMYCDYTLRIAEGHSGFLQVRRGLSLHASESTNGIYCFSQVRNGMIRIIEDLSMNREGPPRFVITQKHEGEINQVEPRLMASGSCFKFFSEPSEIYADDTFAIGCSGESVLRIRCREHEPEFWDLTCARIDGEGSKTLEIFHRPAANDYLMSTSKDGLRVALLPRTSGLIYGDESEVDIDQILRPGTRFRDRVDHLVDDEISSHDPSSSRYMVKLYEMMNGNCQKTIVLDENETPKELRFLCNRRLLVRMAAPMGSDQDHVDLIEIDTHCSCDLCRLEMSLN